LNWKVTLVIVVALLLLASITFVYLLPKAPSYPIDPSTFTKSASETSSATGMEITAELNATVIRAGQGLSLTATAFNTLLEENNLSFTGFPLQGMVGIEAPIIYTTLGLSVYSGYYTLENVTSAPAMSLPPLIETGPQSIPLYIIFAPTSNNATLYVSEGVVVGQYSMVEYNYSYSGTGVLTGSCSGQNCRIYQPLKAGIYTIAVGAEWDRGEFVLLHFLIK